MPSALALTIFWFYQFGQPLRFGIWCDCHDLSQHHPCLVHGRFLHPAFNNQRFAPLSPLVVLTLNTALHFGFLRFARSTSDLHDPGPQLDLQQPLSVSRPASPPPANMPYLQPKLPSPTMAEAPLIMPAIAFPPSTPSPPVLNYANISGEIARSPSTSIAETTRSENDLRDANMAACPLRVPRSRSRGSRHLAIPAIPSPPQPETAPGPSSSDLSTSSPASMRKAGALRAKRAHDQREPLVSITQQPPTPDAEQPVPTPLLSPASLSSPTQRKHEPIRPGSGLRLDLAAIRRTYSEAHVAPSRATMHSHRLSDGDVPSFVRKKSGEVLKSSLKPFRRAGPEGAAMHVPSPSKSGFTTPVESYSPGTSPRAIRLPCKSAPATPTASKSVHFDAQLEHVKLFLAEQKPAAVSRTGSPKEDSDTSGTERGRHRGLSAFGPHSPSSEDDRVRASLSLRIVNAAPVVRDTLPAGIDVQAQTFTLTADKRNVSVGILVRNIAFNKLVVVRFTLDNWQTTSEVVGKHVESAWSESKRRGRDDPDMDRFACVVRLDDFGGRIKQKTMLAAVRYDSDGRTMWDNNSGRNYQIVFEPLKDQEPPSPNAPLESLDKKLEALDRNGQQHHRRDWFPRSSTTGNMWQMRSAAVPHGAPNTFQWPAMKTKQSSSHTNGNRSWSLEPVHKLLPGAAHQGKLNNLRDTRGSPRDLDDPEFTHFRPTLGARGDSDSELDARGPKLRKKPNSYFDIGAPSSFQTWASVTSSAQVTVPQPPVKAGPVFEIGGDPSASSSDCGSDAGETLTPQASQIFVAAAETPSCSGSSETEPSTMLVPPVPRLDDSSRTSSSSSISSQSSWDLPPSPQNALPMPFAAAVYDGAEFSPLSMISTPAVTTATSTNANSPDLPSSPTEEFVPSGRSLHSLDSFFGGANAGRPAVDSSNYSYFLDR